MKTQIRSARVERGEDTPKREVQGTDQPVDRGAGDSRAPEAGLAKKLGVYPSFVPGLMCGKQYGISANV